MLRTFQFVGNVYLRGGRSPEMVKAMLRIAHSSQRQAGFLRGKHGSNNPTRSE